jgi:hypothetical protein
MCTSPKGSCEKYIEITNLHCLSSPAEGVNEMSGSSVRVLRLTCNFEGLQLYSSLRMDKQNQILQSILGSWCQSQPMILNPLFKVMVFTKRRKRQRKQRCTISKLFQGSFTCTCTVPKIQIQIWSVSQIKGETVSLASLNSG